MKKKYLIDIPHPHFVHFFKNIIRMIGTENVVITCQDSGIITELLTKSGFDFQIIGRKYDTLLSKALGQMKYLANYHKIIKENKIDYLLGMSPAIALASKITRKKIYVFDDDDSAVQPITRRLTIPLSDVIITPECLKFENYGKKHITYRGYQELAYLSPKYFRPDYSVIKKYGLSNNSYFILRFNDFTAHHDFGQSGIPEKSKIDLIHLLRAHGKVVITSEGKLSEKYSSYQLKVDPIDIHHLLAFAKLYIGDSQTMASEAAVLGTPSLRCNTFKGKISYLDELEKKYHLTFAFLPEEIDKLITLVNDLLRENEIKNIWSARKDLMLEDMEDVNDFILNIIQN